MAIGGIVRGVLAGLIALLVAGDQQAGAANPSRAAVRCRRGVARAVDLVVDVGLQEIDACHKRQDRGRFKGDCNSLTAALDFQRALVRGAAIVGQACKAGNAAQANYLGGDVAGAVFPEIQRLLEESGGQLLGSPTFVGDKHTMKPRRRCHEGVARARASTVRSVLGASIRCQQKLDKKASEFGPIAPSCLAGPSARPGTIIAKQCRTLSGIEVGSCANLPGCLVDGATKTGQAMARVVYGGPATCGNGLREPGEGCGPSSLPGCMSCDDGNLDDGDGCDSNCTVTACGNGVVSPDEECDDGNDLADDGCNACKAAGCGDGIRSASDGFPEEDPEECDDGNGTPGDGCTECVVDPTICGPDGVEATVEVEFSLFHADFAAMMLNLHYPATVSVPGSGALPFDRVTDLTGSLGLFADADRVDPRDGVDDTVILSYAQTDNGFDSGDFAKVKFDCAPGTSLKPRDFVCRIQEVADNQGNNLGLDRPKADGTTEVYYRCRVKLPVTGGSVTTTTSSTSSTSLPTTTTTTTTSTTTTTLPCTNTCGDGIRERCEECDDGAGNSDTLPDACRTTCKLASCGDSVQDTPETCDDGNTDDNDSCPRDCVIDACTPVVGSSLQATVNFTPPPGRSVAGITILVDYPEGTVNVPGVGGPIPGGFFTDVAAGTNPVGNNLRHAVRVVSASGGAIAPGRLFHANFRTCQGAPAPSSADFSCTVLQASDLSGAPVTGVTCSVSVPPPPTTTTTTTTSTTTTTLPCTNTCGDGVPERCEECDDGAANSDTLPDACRTTCKLPSCGDAVQDTPETCDDGNTEVNDTCPADCVIDACTPVVGSSFQATVSFAPPPGLTVAGITVLVDHPEGAVNVPGVGGPIPGSFFSNAAAGTNPVGNNLRHAFRVVSASGGAITPGRLFVATFRTCTGVPAPTASAFTCTVLQATDLGGSFVTGATCSVTVP